MISRALVAGFVTFSAFASASAAPRHARQERSPRHGLIHPLLDVDPNLEFHELRPFQHVLHKEIKRLQELGGVTSIAYYFRDLDNGPTMGKDGHLPFKPASLLKVPVMFAILKAAAAEPGLLDRKVAAMPPFENLEQYFRPLRPVTVGKEYTVRELITAMIVSSDNAAARTLISTLSNAQYLDIFSDLGLRIPDIRDLDDPVSVVEYATFFRILYNASYLSREHSQYALELLAAAEFKRGLSSGVPKGVTIAHKFGEGSSSEGLKLLHDCGIIYHEKNPYVLCVMTKGADIERMADAIASVSNIVYREVDADARQRDVVPSADGRKSDAAASGN